MYRQENYKCEVVSVSELHNTHVSCGTTLKCFNLADVGSLSCIAPSIQQDILGIWPGNHKTSTKSKDGPCSLTMFQAEDRVKVPFGDAVQIQISEGFSYICKEASCGAAMMFFLT